MEGFPVIFLDHIRAINVDRHNKRTVQTGRDNVSPAGQGWGRMA
jgi:hypothetical protein